MHLEHFDKMWGYLSVDTLKTWNNKQHWVWWANTGKTISLKQETFFQKIRKTESIKQKNNYQFITQEQLLEKWPNIVEQLDNRLLYEILSNG